MRQTSGLLDRSSCLTWSTLSPKERAAAQTRGGSGSKPRGGAGGGGAKRSPSEDAHHLWSRVVQNYACHGTFTGVTRAPTGTHTRAGSGRVLSRGEKGTINTWNNDRQFGFVSCDSGRPWAAVCLTGAFVRTSKTAWRLSRRETDPSEPFSELSLGLWWHALCLDFLHKSHP